MHHDAPNSHESGYEEAFHTASRRNKDHHSPSTDQTASRNLRFGALNSRPVGNREDSDRLREDSHGVLTIGVGPLGVAADFAVS